MKKPRTEERAVLIHTFVSEKGLKLVMVDGADGLWDPAQVEQLGRAMIEQADVCRRLQVTVAPKETP